MKYLAQFLAVLSVFTALIGASPLSRRGSRSPSPAQHAPAGTDHVFIVYYHPLGGVSKRHWAIFVTPSATSVGSTGTIYQVVDDTQANGNLKPEKRTGVQASAASRYEGSVSLGQLNGHYMETHFNEYSEIIRDMIADHNKEHVRPADQSNCQHWTTMMVEWLIDEHVLPAGGKAEIATIPK
jgi:hypothetical protein